MANNTDLFDWDLIPQGKKLVVACSGGPDSMFLLSKILEKISPANILVCHVNYHQRSESDNDEMVVTNFCKKNHLKYFILDTSKEPSNLNAKGNFQALARCLRYDFCCQIALANATRWILVAHHKQDSLETFIIQKKRKNLVKYYGLAKKAPYVFENRTFWLLRPLLNYSKEIILQDLHRKEITYAVDSSNAKNTYLRNRIRKQLNGLENKELLTEMRLSNLRLEEASKKIKKIFVEKKIIYARYLELEYVEKLRAIYELLERNIPDQIHQKKSSIIKEIVKQFAKQQKNQSFIFSKHLQVVKSTELIFVRES